MTANHSTAAIADALIATTAEQLGLRDDVEPTDWQIIDAYKEAFGGSDGEAIARLVKFAEQYLQA